jgi:hypothetical protein
MITDYGALITSKHNQKPKFMALVALLTGAIADIADVAESLPSVFDLDNAVGVQLDAVGRWVGQSRVIPNVLLTGFFGFLDQSPPDLTMGELTDPTVGGVFYELGSTFQQTSVLADPDYRTIIRARIVRNQSNGTLSAIENALQFIFQVPCHVNDIGTLGLGIVIGKPITQIQQALLNSLDLLPRPSGVKIGSITYSP